MDQLPASPPRSRVRGGQSNCKLPRQEFQPALQRTQARSRFGARTPRWIRSNCRRGRKAPWRSAQRVDESRQTEADARLRSRADFETAKGESARVFPNVVGRQRLAGVDPPPGGIRRQQGPARLRLEGILSSLLQRAWTSGAECISFFICIDFARGSWRLRCASWGRVPMRWPHLTNLSRLAEPHPGADRLCNATILFLALSVLGVEHAALLRRGLFYFVPGADAAHDNGLGFAGGTWRPSSGAAASASHKKMVVHHGPYTRNISVHRGSFWANDGVASILGAWRFCR